jgi:PilZ domain-containing protein
MVPSVLGRHAERVDRDRPSAALRQPYSGFKRIACSEPCDVTDTDGTRSGVVWNLSVVGAYIVVNTPPKEGEQIQLSFSLPQDPTPIKAIARVVWENGLSLWPGCGQRAAALPPGCGTEFIGLEAADRARINARVRSVYPESERPPAPAGARE